MKKKVPHLGAKSGWIEIPASYNEKVVTREDIQKDPAIRALSVREGMAHARKVYGSLKAPEGWYQGDPKNPQKMVLFKRLIAVTTKASKLEKAGKLTKPETRAWLKGDDLVMHLGYEAVTSSQIKSALEKLTEIVKKRS